MRHLHALPITLKQALLLLDPVCGESEPGGGQFALSTLQLLKGEKELERKGKE